MILFISSSINLFYQLNIYSVESFTLALKSLIHLKEFYNSGFYWEALSWNFFRKILSEMYHFICMNSFHDNRSFIFKFFFCFSADFYYLVI